MPTVLVEDTTRYVASAPFTTTIQTGGKEFKAQEGNGLPRECLEKRSFIITQDTQLQVEGVKTFLPKGQALRDVGQAHKVLKERPDNIEVRDRVNIPQGTELPAALGKALFESRAYPVKALKADVPEIDPEAAAAAEKAAAEAAKKAEKEAAAAAKKAEADAKKAAEGK